MRFTKLIKHETIHFSITAIDINSAEQLWIHEIQEQEYKAELSHLRRGHPKTKLVRNLNLYLDGEGSLRSRVLAAATNDPVLLPKEKFLTAMIINDAPATVAHDGFSATLVKVRENFWMLAGCQKVKNRLRRCQLCRRLQALPCATRLNPQLPPFRLHQLRAVGVDYCGPLFFSQ